ncbi:MAG: hypothetical protein M3Y54_00285 [Bacteroidota bacterium]|nr:hypothetical protein [Bacteroidota bacterium]
MAKKVILSSLLFCLGTIYSFGQTVGGDKDKHGCLASAGYTYSTLSKKCIRVFEQALKLDNAFLKQSSTSQTCILFSKDTKKAEIFVAGKEGTVLDRFGAKGHYLWKNGGYVVGNTNGYYIKKDGVLIYRQK